jgi:hypothetical protein
MDANFDTNVDDRAEVGVGQASDAVAPISASSLFNAAEAASNLGAVSNTLSMPGAIVAPATGESEKNQVPNTGESGQRKDIGKMTPSKKQCADPLVVDYGQPTTINQKLVARFKSRTETHGYSEGIADEVLVGLVKMAMLRNCISIEQVPNTNSDNHYQIGIQLTDEITIGETVFDGCLDKRLTKFLGIPKPIKLKNRKVSKTLSLMAEVTGYDTSGLEGLEHGDLGATVSAVQGGDYSDRMSTDGYTLIHMSFHGINLEPLSVSDFGNFLHAVKNHGDEVALATLHRIYSKSA